MLIIKNALPLLAGTLQSLKDQTFSDFEVVVVDGGSTDGTLAVLNEAAQELPLRIVSEPDRSLADAFAKGLVRATGDIVGMICADERYYPNTLEQVVKWFEAEPHAAMCGGKVDFIDERDRIVGSDLTAPFNLPAHLACELVPANLASFFNRLLIGVDFRFDADVPSCPDYEYWARLGFRFPPSAFKRYDLSVAQAYRTRDSMSFRAESFTQLCRDKLTHLNNLLAKDEVGADYKAMRRRASAGIHMWAAEQLNGIQPGHPDILAHCARAARYDNSYDRIGHLVRSLGNVRYYATIGIVQRNCFSPRAAAIAEFEPKAPPAYWVGAAIISDAPLTVQTASANWGYSLELCLPEAKRNTSGLDGAQYWIRIDLEVIEGCVGVSLFLRGELMGEQLFAQKDGRSSAVIALPAEFDPASSVMFRSGERSSSIVRVYRAELLCDPDRDFGTVAPIELAH